MRFVIQHSEADEVVARLSTHNVWAGEDARAAVEWLTAGDEEDASAVLFSECEVQDACSARPRREPVRGLREELHLMRAEVLAIGSRQALVGVFPAAPGGICLTSSHE